MIKRIIGWIMYILVYPLLLTGGALLIFNIMVSSANLQQKTTTDFVTPIIMILLGLFFKVSNEKLRNVRW